MVAAAARQPTEGIAALGALRTRLIAALAALEAADSAEAIDEMAL